MVTYYLSTRATLWMRARVMGVILVGTGILAGSYLTLSRIIIPWARAITETTISMSGDVAFNAAGYSDNTGAVSVLSSEVRIATSSAWLDGAYLAKKTITLNNLSGQILEASGSAQVTVYTKELYDAGKLQADCNDLRIVHVATASANTRTELPRSYQIASGATNCADSTATIVTFPRQEKLWPAQASGNYEMYYGDSTATAPVGNGGVVSGTKTPTLWCPFAGSTTCIDGETPTTATGAIRYSGGKSALVFDGSNDYVNVGNVGAGVKTVELWVYGTRATFSLIDLNGSAAIQVIDGTLTTSGFSSPTIYINGVATTTFPTHVWNHVAVVTDTGIDASAFVVGMVGGSSLAGRVDELRVSDTVRYSGSFTPSARPFTPDVSTKLLFHFDENGDDPRNTGKALDASGNGNHGTITGAKYVGGLLGADSSATDTGALPTQSYAGHQGVFIEEGTTNLVSNPSFENATFNSLWGPSAFTYATTSATFTPNMAKRNSAGPFAAGPMVQGKWDGTATSDILVSQDHQTISGNFKQYLDGDQGSIVFWVTPEWNGNDNKAHYLFVGNGNTAFSISKKTSNVLELQDGAGTSKVQVDVSSWTAGSTYQVVARWDSKNTLNGTHFASLSINDVHTFGGTSFTGSVASRIRIGHNWNYNQTGDAVIEGLTIYRRALYDGTYGTNVGNGDEINQIYNGDVGKDPTLVTGSWDVVFALPTNASTGTLSTGTGNAWSMPHTSNLIGGTNGAYGFMTSGDVATDGFTVFSPNKLSNGTFESNLNSWSGTQSYLLRDEFTDSLAAGSVHGTTATDGVNVRTVTDPSNKISIGSGLLTLGASAGYGSGISYPTLTRTLGKTLIGAVGISNTSTQVGFGTNVPSSGFDFIAGSTLQVYDNGSSIGNYGTYSAGTYQLAQVYRNSGQYYFIKGGLYSSWTLLAIGKNDTASRAPHLMSLNPSNLSTTADSIKVPSTTFLPTPIVYDTFTRTDGALGSSESSGPDGQTTPVSPWTGGAISGNKLVITPTQGSDVITNGNFASWSGGNPDNWVTNESLPTTEVREVGTGENHGGSGTGMMNLYSADGTYVYSQQNSILTTGNWYQLSFLQDTRTAGTMRVQWSELGNYNAGTTTGNKLQTGRANTTYLMLRRESVETTDITIDDVSMKPLTLSSLFSTVSTSDTDVVASADVTMTSGTQAGVATNLDSASTPANFLIAYHDGTNVRLDKNVGGTYTNLISTAVTYSAGATLRVITDKSSGDLKVRVYYNNALVGTEQIVTDAAIKAGTIHGLFSTYAGNSFDNFTLFARGTGGEYNSIPAEDLTVTRDTGIKFSGVASAKLVAAGNDANFVQTTNVGDTRSYHFTAYAYTTGAAVTSADAELYYGSATVATSYVSVGSGWYRMDGTITGIASDQSAGVRVKAGKTVYVDGMSIIEDAASSSAVALATDQKIYSGGYAVASSQWGGMHRDITVSAGQDLVIRGIAHSDGTSQPQLILYDQSNGVEIGSLYGTTSSTRANPDVLLFTGEVPSGCTTVRVKLVNAAATVSSVHWHQVEVYNNLVTNPSMESGLGDPWIPTGWGNVALDSSDAQASSTGGGIRHSGSDGVQFTTSAAGEGLLMQRGGGTIGNFVAGGVWSYGDGSQSITWGEYGGHFVIQDGGLSSVETVHSASWVQSYGVFRSLSAFPTLAFLAESGATGNRYIDDAYMINLDSVSLTVTPASSANSTETSGLRVDGADTLTQSITGLTATNGVIKFKFRPRHSLSVAGSFGNATPTIFSIGSSSNTIQLNRLSDTSVQLNASFNGTSKTINASSTLNADTTYSIEIAYNSTGNMEWKIDGVSQGTTAMSGASFGTVPTTAYFGHTSSSTDQYEGTFTSFVTASATENTTPPYYKFGSKSVKLVGQDSPDEYVTSVTTTSNTRNTVSAYVYDGTTGNVGGNVDATVATIASGSASLSSTYTDVGGGWWRMSYTDPADIPTGTYQWGVQVKAGKTIYVDGVQAESKSYATTYTDGTLGTGYTWAGTAHASTSTRTAGSLTYSTTGNISSTAGTISLWFKPNWDSTDTVERYFVATNADRMYFFKNSTNMFRFYPNYDDNSGRYISTNLGSSIVPGRWHHLVVTYDQSGDVMKFYLNGSEMSITSVGAGWLAPTYGNTLTVGQSAGSVISDTSFIDNALTTAEVADLYYQGLTTHSEGSESDDKYDSGAKTYTSPVIDLSANGAWGATPWADTTVLNGGTVTYYTRTSADNSSWSDWEAVAGSTIASPARRYLQWKADLAANAELNNSPVITGMSVTYVEDGSAPTNPDTTALGYTDTASASATLTSGEWYNYPTPKFSWDAAVDEAANGQSASGVDSYHVLLTTDNTATPSAHTGDVCYVSKAAGNEQFVVGTSPANCVLSNGTWYLRLHATDNSGNTSDPVTLFTYKYDGSIPLAPTSVSSTTPGYSATNSFTFYWPAASDQGPSGVAGYEYKTGATDAAWTYTTGTTAENVQAYTEGQNLFYVRSKDMAGNYSGTTSNNVAASSFYYNSSAPTAPTDVVISPTTSAESPALDNVFDVTWSRPASYSGEIAKYYYCVNCTPSATTMTETTPAETVNRTLTDVALATQQGKNTFYIVAEDNNLNVVTGRGNRNFDAYTSIDFYASTVAPGAPTGLTVSDVSDRDNSLWRLTLVWKAPVGGGVPASYRIYQSTDGGGTYALAGSTTSTAYTAADLTRNTVYMYKVYAVDNAGSLSLASNVVSGSPQGKYSTPPSAGGVPTVTPGSTTAIVNWSTGRTAYGSVEYGKLDSYGAVASEASPSASHAIKVSGLAPGETYHYRVQSLDDSSLVGYERSAAYSSDYTFTTLTSPAITDISIDEVTLTSAVLSWKTASLATAKVEYGETTAYGSSVDVSTTASENTHTARLSGLIHSKTYHFRVRGVDVDGNDIFSQDNILSTLTFPKVTATVLSTDQGASGTSVVMAWSTNVPTTGEVQYQPVAIDVEHATRWDGLVVETEHGKEINKEVLSALSPTELAVLPVIPSGDITSLYIGKMETKHVQRISALDDGSIYVFTIRGRDANGNEAVSEPLRYMTGADTRPPKIMNVIVETPMSGVGADAKSQMIVSFETDEPSVGIVKWGAGTGSEYPQTTEKEQGYSTRHVVVVRDLAPTSSYHFQIVTTDETGNMTESPDTVVVTPAAQAAAFDLIIKNLEDVFGFLKF